ncbi:transcriptional regulator [Massilia solisilvae]|uniref:Transcriptional regulator n=1 Tax=Massilia solisilvae TaxID=1811225 RepID=A0ABT2BNK6_9BURK|nr:transcriptional regulator [Massilia solisilvae]MCS0609976.1 transcriptional regulator [Massilia solisilvae]
MTKRNIFAELMEGLDALEGAREGKVTLRKTEVARKAPPEMTAAKVRAVRAKLHVSQPVFALKLRTEPRTIKNWEQGISKPNAQAAILLSLIDRDPKLLDEIAAL